MNSLSILPVEDAESFKHGVVSVIRIGGDDHAPDIEPDLVDQALAYLNEVMRGRETMPLTELRQRVDNPARRVRGFLMSDLILIGIFATNYGEYPWLRGPYGLLFEWPDYPHLTPMVVWHEHLFERDEDGRLTLVVDPEAGEESC